jgi:hypothetical protein
MAFRMRKTNINTNRQYLTEKLNSAQRTNTTTNQPVVKKPVVQKPVVKKPVVQKPVVKKYVKSITTSQTQLNNLSNPVESFTVGDDIVMYDKESGLWKIQPNKP